MLVNAYYFMFFSGSMLVKEGQDDCCVCSKIAPTPTWTSHVTFNTAPYDCAPPMVLDIKDCTDGWASDYFCHSVIPNANSTDACGNLACYCPAGLVTNGQQCVPVESCPCKTPAGDLLQPGDELKDSEDRCMKYVCANNMLSRVPNLCSPCDPSHQVEGNETADGYCLPDCFELNQTQEDCGPDEDYVDCLCPQTCVTMAMPDYNCSACVPGCQKTCDPGLVLDDQGNCIDPMTCPCYDDVFDRYMLMYEVVSNVTDCSRRTCVCSDTCLDCYSDCHDLNCSTGSVAMMNTTSGCCYCDSIMLQPPPPVASTIQMPCRKIVVDDCTGAIMPAQSPAPGQPCMCDANQNAMRADSGEIICTIPCTSCQYGGSIYNDGDVWTIPSDCKSCSCQNKAVTCVADASVCMSTTTSAGTTQPNQVTTPTDCVLNGGCYDSTMATCYQLGDTWNRDPCSTCVCEDSGSAMCNRTQCLPITCGPGQVTGQLDDQCCPTCQDVTTVTVTTAATGGTAGSTSGTTGGTGGTTASGTSSSTVGTTGSTTGGTGGTGSTTIGTGGTTVPGGSTSATPLTTLTGTTVGSTDQSTTIPGSTGISVSTTGVTSAISGISTVTGGSSTVTVPQTTPQGCTPTVSDVVMKNPAGLDGCVDTLTVSQTSCGGTCQSSASVDLQTQTISSDCTCCKPDDVSIVSVDVSCDSSEKKVTFQYYKINSCSCASCDYAPDLPDMDTN